MADASPTITAAKLPATYHAGKPVTITGTVTNASPAIRRWPGSPSTIDRVVNNLPVPVATGTTDAKGAFTITFVPPVNGSYELTTSQIAQVEDSTLNPAFGDLLSPASTTPVKITVHSAVTKLSAPSRAAPRRCISAPSPRGPATSRAS